MSENTAIEWATHTFNPWEKGCTKVGPGCDHCYAEVRNARYNGGASVNWGSGVSRRRTSEENWKKPGKWNKKHDKFFAEHGHRQRVFCSSLADVFDNEVDPQWRQDLFKLIMATPNLDWLLLTKRIGNAAEMLTDVMLQASCGSFEWTQETALKNVWIGATIVNQAEADRDIPKLLATPASCLFVSMEPLLGPVNLTELVRKLPIGEHHYNALECDVDPLDDGEWEGRTINWVIVGGESGKDARPMHPDWVRNLREQCALYKVPFLFKQWGEYSGASFIGAPVRQWVMVDINGLTLQEAGSTKRMGPITHVAHVGKKKAGRLLDGITHDGFPA